MKKKNAPVDLLKIVSYCDTLLNHARIEDWAGAKNGLQLQNDGTVGLIAAAVDASEMTLRMAVEAGANLLLVHHGMAWEETMPIRGAKYRKLRLALGNNLAVYSSHLPLDMHPKLGNNILLAQALGLKNLKPCMELKGSLVGYMGTASLSRKAFLDRVKTAVGGGSVNLIGGGSDEVRKVCVVTGGAGGEVARAKELGADTFVTGEGSHATFNQAHELGINLIYAGHYATETFGVRALAEHVSKQFSIPWLFLDVPSLL